MILQSSKNPKRNTHRDVNTLGGNTLGLLREVCNFVLFRHHDCVVQQSLNEKYKFLFYIASVKTFSGTKANHTKSWILNCYLYQYACRDLFPVCHD